MIIELLKHTKSKSSGSKRQAVDQVDMIANLPIYSALQETTKYVTEKETNPFFSN
ncbi:hypothetical protein V1498_03545 [Peribacillus sp. SCS-26]|uniref:hypothetical protein n=1 Tax=Paraperibacillus marinus TaxID=3115295 RepID=UPI00390627F9